MLDKIKNYKYHLNNSYLDAPLSFGDTELWQAGRLFCNPAAVIRTHTHPLLFELTVVTAGKGRVFTNGEPTEVAPCDIYFSFPYEEHKIVSDEKEPLQYDFYSFMTKNEELYKRLDEITRARASSAERIFRDEGICDLVSQVICELEGSDEYTERMLDNICEQITLRIIRAFTHKGEASKKYGVTEAEALCYQAMNYVDTHIYSIRSLTEVADSINYNYSYLSNLFKRTTGQALMDYYRSRRLEEARRLLCEQGRSVTRIAEMLNYSSVYAFSRAFKERYGISPNQYKKEHNEK